MFSVKVPPAGESISEVSVSGWFKKEGDLVQVGDRLCTLDTEKASVDIEADQAGVLSIKAQEGQTLRVGDELAVISKAQPGEPVSAPAQSQTQSAQPQSQPQPQSAPAAKPSPAQAPDTPQENHSARIGPAERRRMALAGAGASSGAAKASNVAAPAAAPQPQGPIAPQPAVEPAPSPAQRQGGSVRKQDQPIAPAAPGPRQRQEPLASGGAPPVQTREPMSRLRQTIARRLVESQHATATLSTFNEIDMSRVLGLRAQYKEEFKKRHEVNLGFMGFFTRAVLEALKLYPKLNAFIEASDIVYNHIYNIGIAVGTRRGLIVPVIRDAGRLSLAEIELGIRGFALKAREGKIEVRDLEGGTFTISNGGVYGSLFSTPILNPPQSGILGLHKVEDRPVVVDGKIEVRPMMYVALSYDHRLVDGTEAVQFLAKVKECIEEPSRLLLEL